MNQSSMRIGLRVPRPRRRLRLSTILGTGLTVGIVVSLLGYTTHLARQSSLKTKCENRLKLVALALRSFHRERGSLPPAYLTDDQGNPTLSWRVLVEGQIGYEENLTEQLVPSVAWNEGNNADVLAQFAPTRFRCPASKDPNDKITHFVAVVGPGTLWPGSHPAQLPPSALKNQGAGGTSSSPQPILLIDWPHSDIHWAEPRDVTVDQFLDWFRSKPDGPPTHHRRCLLYVDAAAQVHELPIDSDPETVRKLLMVQPSERADESPVAAR